VKKQKEIGLEFIVDKLTNSIEKIELDVDFIGGQDSLTKAEEKALSDFFSRRKQNKSQVKKTKVPV